MDMKKKFYDTYDEKKLLKMRLFSQRKRIKIQPLQPVENWYQNELAEKDSDEKMDPSSFHRAIRIVLLLAQISGIFPVSGILSHNINKVKYHWYSIPGLYGTGINICTILMAYISIHYMVIMMQGSKDKAEVFKKYTPGAIFYINASLSTYLFRNVARKWPGIIFAWTKLETNMWGYGYASLGKTYKLIAGIILGLSFVEHANSVYINMPSISDGKPHSGSGFFSYLEEYCLNSHYFVFNVLNYNWLLAIYVAVISNTATFAWNFQDVFIILISQGLTKRLELLNERIRISSEHQTIRREDWRKLRELYGELSALVKLVDASISPIVALSFMNNLYFICYLMFQGVGTNATSTFLLIYNYSGFLFMFFRAISVTISAAQLQFRSRIALEYIYCCPSEIYTVETGRLFDQLNSDLLCLTGCGFFSINRGFLLSVAGMIATYEVVLLQLDDKLSLEAIAEILNCTREE